MIQYRRCLTGLLASDAYSSWRFTLPETSEPRQDVPAILIMADAPASFCQRLGGRWIREDMTTLLIRSWTTPAVRHLHDILIGSAGPRLERAVASPSCRHSRTSHVDETGLPAIAKQPQEGVLVF